MATIRKRGRSWQVQVRRVGIPASTQSFPSKSEAVSWAKAQERESRRSAPPSTRFDTDDLTVGALLLRYQIEITPLKKGHVSENCRIRNIVCRPIAGVALRDLTSGQFAVYRNARLKDVGPDTVRRELSLLRHCFEIARREWDIPIAKNPLHDIRFPAPGLPREERLTEESARTILSVIGTLRNKHAKSLIVLAIETGMRRGELLSLEWKDVDLQKRTARLRDTKNGRPRTVPLTTRAIDELSDIERVSKKVLPIYGNAARLTWERVRLKANLPGLRFHDLRHEALSRFFEMGLTIPEVAVISGHRDTKMLMRYTHIRPEDIGRKLARIAEEAAQPLSR
ncbi:site-specific integrase [Methylobacterium sp. Leaf111]|uniref:site-specific integrase n=1 Tax=Methylobacterium sp. Leaf111 TaxID=1736257 RepID=UPI0009E83EFD|nr:site-specific integrase [Methylobacterium sp. Leaf111]